MNGITVVRNGTDRVRLCHESHHSDVDHSSHVVTPWQDHATPKARAAARLHPRAETLAKSSASAVAKSAAGLALTQRAGEGKRWDHGDVMREPAGLARISIGLDELARLKLIAARERPYAERLSAGLTLRLLTSARDDAPFVLDAIDHLEGIRPSPNIKAAAQFEHAPLHPLWHQHFFTPRHMIRNIGERWGIARGKGNRDLNRMIAHVANDFGHDPDVWQGVLAKRLADGYVERSQAGRLTGDWIVFAEHEGQRYYLDLSMHEEGESAQADQLLAKLKGSASAEFPFVFAF